MTSMIPTRGRGENGHEGAHMEIGLLTDSLSSMTRTQALDTAAGLGIETTEPQRKFGH